MSGSRFLLDTNAVVALLRGEGRLASTLEDAEWVGISILTVLEFLSFEGLSPEDRSCFAEFESRVAVVDLTSFDTRLLDAALQYRRVHRLKLPDAVVAASARVNGAVLVSADRDFARIDGIMVMSDW